VIGIDQIVFVPHAIHFQYIVEVFCSWVFGAMRIGIFALIISSTVTGLRLKSWRLNFVEAMSVILAVISFLFP